MTKDYDPQLLGKNLWEKLHSARLSYLPSWESLTQKECTEVNIAASKINDIENRLCSQIYVNHLPKGSR